MFAPAATGSGVSNLETARSATAADAGTAGSTRTPTPTSIETSRAILDAFTVAPPLPDACAGDPSLVYTRRILDATPEGRRSSHPRRAGTGGPRVRVRGRPLVPLGGDYRGPDGRPTPSLARRVRRRPRAPHGRPADPRGARRDRDHGRGDDPAGGAGGPARAPSVRVELHRAHACLARRRADRGTHHRPAGTETDLRGLDRVLSR